MIKEAQGVAKEEEEDDFFPKRQNEEELELSEEEDEGMYLLVIWVGKLDKEN